MILAILTGDYFVYRAAIKKAGDYELPKSLAAWAKAERIRLRYSWEPWEIK